MTADASTFLSNVLQRTGLFSPEQVSALLAEARQSDVGITEIVASEGFAREEDYLQALAGALNIPFRRLSDESIDQEVLERLPTKAVFQYNVIPVSFENGVLHVASAKGRRTKHSSHLTGIP